MATKRMALLTTGIGIGIGIGIGLGLGADPLAAETGRPATGPPGSMSSLWIGARVDRLAPCPNAGPSWSASPLFVGADGHPSLGAFCRYAFQARGPVGDGDLAALAALVPGQLSALGRDAMAIGGNAPATVDDSLWRPLAAHFLAQAGAAGAFTADFGGPGVRLAVLDTTPTTDVDPHLVVGNGPHGHALLNMAHQLLCARAPGSCGVHLTSRLALSYLTFAPDFDPSQGQDPIRGGYVGTISELAAAIHAEIEAWQAAGVRDQRLVVNLSVGWDPTFGGLEPAVEDMPVPVQAVYRAVEDAACRGALVVAAAGNRTGGPSPALGPVLPAAWHARPAPAACPEPLHPPETAPLVLAAGGVMSDGEPLANARPRSASAWAAYGDHGVVATVDGQPTAILTGSSVATLVISAAAAAAWNELPDMSRGELVTLLYEAGDALPRLADVCLAPYGAPCDEPVRRVGVCRSVLAACSLAGGACASCPPWDPSPPDLDASFVGLDPVASLDLLAISEPYPQALVCQPDVPHFDPIAGPAADPCPDRQYTSVAATPWVHPQPGSDPCPPCRVDRSIQTMVVEIDPSFEGVLSAPTLTLCGTAYSLTGLSLQPGAVNEVANVDATGCSNAEVSFTVTNADGSAGSAISAAVVVD